MGLWGHTVVVHGGQQRGQGSHPCSTEDARGDDRQTDRQTHTRSVHYMMITTVLCLKKPNSSLPMLAKL